MLWTEKVSPARSDQLPAEAQAEMIKLLDHLYQLV